MMPRLSVIIPVYNTPKELLEHCIDSIRQNLQDMEEAEVLLINDGSTAPHIEQMLQDAEASDSRFKYVYKENGGVSETRNVGIDMAKSEYITFVDADDYLEPEALQYMVEKMEETGADMGIYGYNKEMSAQIPKFQKVLTEEEKRKVLFNVIAFLYNADRIKYKINCHASWGIFFKKSILDKYSLRFNTNIAFSEDSIFNFCYITYINKVYVDNKPVYHYVGHLESVTQKCTNGRNRNLPTLIRAWEEFILNNYHDDKSVWHLLGIRTLVEIKLGRLQYFTHPQNQKTFWELKSEMADFLYQPSIKKWIQVLRLSDAKDKVELKQIILLKLHLYWIFLITERRKRAKCK